MSTAVTLTVLHHRNFHTLQDVISRVSGLNLIKHTMKGFMRQLELQKRCEFHVFKSFLIIHV